MQIRGKQQIAIGETEFWVKVWNILETHCDCQYSKNSFLSLQGDFTEFRFQGNLGFGGKVWNNYGVYVNYYHEDMTPERDCIVNVTNKELEKIVREHECLY